MPRTRKRPAHGVYYHSSAPRVLPMNNPMKSNKGNDDGSKEAIVIKPSNIRIWIHDKDISKLTRVLWEGQGNRLRTETSSNPKVKRFLDAVPYIMNVIKDVHSAVIDNDLEALKKKSEPPVPQIILASKDQNGLTPLHKAAGLAHTKIVEHILSAYPQAATELDGTGKTPLHWASCAKNNDRSFNLLVQAGADEEAYDYKMKTPAQYKQRQNDVDRSVLTVIPDAPRVPQQGLPPGYDWTMLGEDSSKAFNNNNNFVKKSQSYYDNENLIKSVPPVLRGSTEAMRQENLVEPNPARTQSEENTQPDPDEEKELTIEEQAVLVAINPEDEKLYHRKSARVSNNTGSTARLNSHPTLHIDPDDDEDDEEDLPTNDALYAFTKDDAEFSENESLNYGDDNVENTSIDGINGNKEQSDDYGRDGSGTYRGSNSSFKSPSSGQDTGRSSIRKYDVVDTLEESNNLSRYNVNGNVDILNPKQSMITKTSEDYEKLLDKENEEYLKSQMDRNSDEDEDDNPRGRERIHNRRLEENGLIEYSDDNDSLNQELDVVEKNKSEIMIVDQDEANEKPPEQSKEAAKSAESNTKPTETDGSDEVQSNAQASPSPALEIQGLVRGEPDNGGLQSQGGNMLLDQNEDSQVQGIINAGDMERLAALVLNGEGSKLVGTSSNQQEIQAFLDNVPAYMNKIRRVHLAARDGSLRDLQSALDRRKFAIAKDEVSPHGATPLHVATIFGHAGIVRYLAGRFPETTSAVDESGRTALHYAATIHDNGHFYNLLTHLGANPKAEDNAGYTAEYFTTHSSDSESVMSHRQLLQDFGAQQDLINEMLSDQDNSKSNQIEIPVFRTEEGRYLAANLGDPLIKGLTEVANKRPSDPIGFLAHYLGNFSKQNNSSDSHSETATVEANNIIQSATTLRKSATASTSTATALAGNNDAADEMPPLSPDGPETALTSDDRDEHGQSMLHFACARAHGRNALIQLIEESGVNITYRDELYRTARDVSLQASQSDNTKEIDLYVLGLAAQGDLESFQTMLLEGYDHILDVMDSDDNSILDVAQSRGHTELVEFYESIQMFEDNRESLHKAVRRGNTAEVQRLTSLKDGAMLTRAKNYYGRTALHIAVLKEHEDIVEYLATNFRPALRLGDNLERTPLHYAMGVNTVETLSRILIKNGSKRVIKDLKGRQPSYYFMNRSDVMRLQEEEGIK